jgi:hypothetical protein
MYTRGGMLETSRVIYIALNVCPNHINIYISIMTAGTDQTQTLNGTPKKMNMRVAMRTIVWKVISRVSPAINAVFTVDIVPSLIISRQNNSSLGL